MLVLVVTGRPRFHWQVELGDGESVGRGGVVCIALEVGSRLRGSELILLMHFSIIHISSW
jgi:hypothetical protein